MLGSCYAHEWNLLGIFHVFDGLLLAELLNERITEGVQENIKGNSKHSPLVD